MKRILFLVVFTPLLFSQCRKEEPLKVVYSVIENSQDQPLYTITYTSDKTGSSTVASSSSAHWDSGTVLLERGQFVSMKVECNAPVYDITFRILVSGFVWKETHLANPGASATLTGTL